jgi:hydrogenase-4 component B
VTAALSVLAGAALSGAGLAVLLGAPPGHLLLPWAIPGGSFELSLDAVAAVFLVPMGIVSALGAVYGIRYWADADHPRSHRLVRGTYGTFVAGMALVVLAGNGVVFLMAWEIMAVAGFVLIATEHERPEVREAAYIYLVATHAATLLLWVMFSRIAAATGVFGFAPLPSGVASTLTILVGLVGFGLKSGFIPLHVWLPGAHASAPTHASALLSGVLLKVGIYGVVRTVGLMAAPPVALGGLVLLLGAISALGGVAFALGQHDIKRLLAYHSIENIGIILLGIGLALMGRSLGHPEWVVLGMAGAFLHVWNHAFFKGLLFLAAGAAIRATGTRVIDRMGGLAATMPRTAALFLVGAIAITGLPPLNGFVSELMIYLGLVRSALPGGAMFAAFATPVLALVGALAIACFVKVFGAVFLGTPRAPTSGTPGEAPASMVGAMLVLAALCAFIGLAPALLAPGLDRAVATFIASSGAFPAQTPHLATLVPFRPVMALGWGLALTVTLLVFVAWPIMARPASTGTWSCGYGAASPRLQYTASSFASSLVGILSSVLRPEEHPPVVEGIFPRPSHHSVHVDDVLLEKAVRPSMTRAGALLTRLRVLQGGHVNLYIFILLLGALLLLLTILPLSTLVRALWT